MKLIWLIILSLLCFQNLVHASQADLTRSEIEKLKQQFSCSTETLLGVSFRYCSRNPETTNNEDIIYFFHGLDGSETTWFEQAPGTLWIQKLWDVHGYSPRIITLSFGPQWLLVSNSRYQLLPFVGSAVIPFLEQKVGGLGSGKRHLIGESMGGFNAAEISLKYPTLFSKVALLCPAIATVGPYSSDHQIQDYIFRTGADPEYVAKMLKISRAVFENQQDWNDHDPLILVKKNGSRHKTRFFVSIGMMDDYGFQEGAFYFYNYARKNNYHSGWDPVFGEHCSFDILGTAKFFGRRL